MVHPRQWPSLCQLQAASFVRGAADTQQAFEVLLNKRGAINVLVAAKVWDNLAHNIHSSIHLMVDLKRKRIAISCCQYSQALTIHSNVV